MGKQFVRTAVSLVAGTILIATPALADQGPQSVAPPALAGQGPQAPLQLADDDRPGLHFIVPWFLRQFLAPYYPLYPHGDDRRRGPYYYLLGDSDDHDDRGYWRGWSGSDDGSWSDSDDGFFDD